MHGADATHHERLGLSNEPTAVDASVATAGLLAQRPPHRRPTPDGSMRCGEIQSMTLGRVYQLCRAGWQTSNLPWQRWRRSVMSQRGCWLGGSASVRVSKTPVVFNTVLTMPCTLVTAKLHPRPAAV